DYWIVPLALSGSSTKDHGGTRTWITPLAHVDRDRDGRFENAHVLNYFHGSTYDVVFPVVWATGHAGNRHYAVVPAWFQGERWWCAPLALSGGATHRDGSSTLWVTPLAHLDRDPDGTIHDAHLLNYFHGKNHDVLFPLLWATGREGNRHYAVAP